MPDPQSIRRLAQTYTAAWSSQNAASVAALYHEKGSLSVNEDPPAVGREAIASVAQSFMTALPDMLVIMDDLHLEDDGAIYHWTLTGTNTGPGGTGRTVRISGFEVWELGTNRLISNSRGHFDSDEYRRQLGQQDD
ncbi:MAG: YybH family protein [Pyrinomonadaceae bacterium]